MLKRSLAIRVVLVALIFSALARSQPVPPQSGVATDQQEDSAAPIVDGWGRPMAAPVNKGRKTVPALHHDISGTWEPANGFLDGVGGTGAKAMPEDGKPEHELPYTPLGLEAFKRARPTGGVLRTSLPAETNDPEAKCNPLGFPRENLFQLRITQILETPDKVLVLYEYDRVWRVIWTDGRKLPKDPEPRWYGYSVGKWADDYTFVVETNGTDDRTWVDHVGRPHSADLRVEERFHRVDHDRLELTVTIDDPRMYTKPWVALDKFPMNLMPADFDVREMICSPSESTEYDKLITNPASEKEQQ